MYVIRRVFEVKPGMARRYATIAMKVAEAYERGGKLDLPDNPDDVRLFGPDEVLSNRLGAAFGVTDRARRRIFAGRVLAASRFCHNSMPPSWNATQA